VAHRLSLIVSLLAGFAGAGCSWFSSGGNSSHPDGGVGDVCVSNADCGAAFICAGGTCELEGSVGLGGACSANRDCSTDLFCTASGVCGPAGSGDIGDPCATGVECKKELVCVAYGFGGSCQAGGSADIGEGCTATSDCLAGLACAPDNTCKGPNVAYPPFTGVDCQPAEGNFRVYFEMPRPGASPADFFRLPFPNDARVAADGTLQMDDFPRPGPGLLGIDLVDLYVDALVADFDGFSSEGSVTFRFAGQLDFDTIGSGAENMHYIDITPSTPEFGSDRGRQFSYTTGRGLYLCPDAFTVGNDPHQPLLPNHTYAVYFTNGIRSASGDTPVQDADFAAVLSDTRPTGNDALANAWDKYQPFRDFLVAKTIDPSTIAGATVFTVQDTVGHLEALRDAVDTEPAPQLTDLTLCDTGVTSPCDDGGVRTCGPADVDFYEIQGRYRVPIYQQGTEPYETPAEGGNIVYDGSGVPQKVRDEDVCMVMLIPKGTTMPTGGWPLAIYGHGTGGSFKNVVANGVGRALAKAGVAVFSWDGVVHGERRGNSTRDPDSLMFNLVNPVAARDNSLQGAVDVLQAMRLGQISAVNVTGVTGGIDFDAGNIFYFGHSQGSNVGEPAVAVSPLPKAAVFSGAGAYLTQGMLSKTSPVNSKAALQLLLGEDVTSSHPVMTILQTYFDKTDTVNYAPLILSRPPTGVAAKHVFMTWASTDTFAPESTLNIMAKTLQLPQAPPVLSSVPTLTTTTRPVSLNKQTPDGGRTAALFQYQADGYDGHFVAQQNPNAIADWKAFITSAVTGAPTVP